MIRAEPTVLQLGPESNGQLLAPWEFDQAEFTLGWRYELVNGVFIVTPPPSLEERDANEELGHWLRAYRESHPHGASLDFTVSEHTLSIGPHRRRVDRAIWAGLGRLPRTNETPTIVVEFVSHRRRNRQRDYLVKRDEYHAAGVQEYWIVDRFDRMMAVYQFSGADMAARCVGENETYSTVLLPGFELVPGRLFMLADRWENQS